MSNDIGVKQGEEMSEEPSFEAAMEELEHIVDQLEAGEVPLEEAIQLFQKGMKLSQNCHQKLEKMEKQVYTLLEEDGELVKKPLDLEEEPS